MYDAKISLKEAAYRLSDIRWIGSYLLRRTYELLAFIFPSKFNSLFKKVKPLTMVSYSRLRGLHEATKYVVQNQIPGDFVECGVARGGSAALVALTALEMGENRNLWLFDTFSGLPRPSTDNPDFDIADLYTGTCVASVREVETALSRFGITVNLRFVPGLFQETLPKAGVDSISLLHIDGDWYESVRACLDHLYDRVSPGGVIQFDDYGHWAGARKAVDEFFRARNLSPRMRHLDFSGRQIWKERG